ncbi:MAG TPA: potassium-transporting ATPase subunit KdpC [Coriobacteriia bacterium]
MKRYVFASIRMAVLTMVVLGLVYPLAVTGLAQVLMPAKANGSLVTSANGTVIGSSLIGQGFTDAKYFHGRPSAAGADGYDATASSASNLAPTSRALVDSVAARVATAVAENPGLTSGTVPVDMVTASGSGLDPDITLANAYAQVARVASARGMSADAVRVLVDATATGRQFGLLGEPHVNVLALNIALDAAK